MLYQMLHFLDNYCLESSRRFKVKGREQDSEFKITWTHKFEASVWDIRHHSIHKQTLTGDLIKILDECGVDLRDFEKKVALFLRAYQAHIQNSLQVLRSCVSTDSPQLRVPSADSQPSRTAYEEHTHLLFALLEQQERSKEQATEGYDLFPLVKHIPFMASAT